MQNPHHCNMFHAHITSHSEATLHFVFSPLNFPCLYKYGKQQHLHHNKERSPLLSNTNLIRYKSPWHWYCPKQLQMAPLHSRKINSPTLLSFKTLKSATKFISPMSMMTRSSIGISFSPLCPTLSTRPQLNFQQLL